MSDDTLLFLSTTMSSNDHERIHEIQSHINQLLAELRLLEPNNSYLENFKSFKSQLTTISHGKYFFQNSCPYLSRKSTKQAILHSTTYNEYKKMNERKKNENILLTSSPRKFVFAASACVTSTPKTSSHENMLLKPHCTSTPRHSTKQSTNIIPLKRLLYNKKKDYNRRRYSFVPFSKRSILPRYCPINVIEENPQWI